ncbi:uncharacterized protein MYCFIDRAFT_213841 [Pseudocercospora fijiensis CIRAD86]|uniref:3',5'-cyclic-nucleotide phosphodiesterase n=1 Tax=Pseudocercospora fijiensis (strain CIRAD86) TaxID=383855 RepID=M3A2I5_PSEFD|nr:uncharacterized protein MYCFIDRAFT_213841 [Pseudocercospora fijiensis CIRAD86]EME85389.1 hypothetical protein MYCFIDRAFT_213841 [Pseudocercospora fijiensis CIRAD86]
MKDTRDAASGSDIGLDGQKPALQVICLGSSGGPSEENVSGFLVRSLASEWSKNSMLAVDAGSHLAPIIRILERDFPSISADPSRSGANGGNTSNGGGRPVPVNGRTPSPLDDNEQAKLEPKILKSGPFAGLKFPNESARANALHVLRTYISTYLITHPHLDHLSGFAINTAAFAATSKPKTLAALPSTVDAIKTHIFNDVIWPNLSDEDGGVGFVTFQRLKEGGDVMVGEGEGRGYIEVCDGLGTRAFKVSHGVCTKSPPSHRHRGSIAGISDSQVPPYNGSIQGTSQDPVSAATMGRSLSISAMQSQPGTPGGTRHSFHGQSHPSPHLHDSPDYACVVDSAAYFLRDEQTQREVLIFGDVEPDSLSLSPRTHIVWQEAARKIAQGVLGGVFIECSYDDSQADPVLFGHLNPKHLIAELQNLASMVSDAKAARVAEKTGKKRKRSELGFVSAVNGLDHAKTSLPESAQKRNKHLANTSTPDDRRRSSAPDHRISEISSTSTRTNASTSPSIDSMKHYQFQPPYNDSEHITEPGTSPRSLAFPRSIDGIDSAPDELPLTGIRIIIIHIKDTLKDGPHVSENILAQLQEHEAGLREQSLGLGCEFIISQSGESYWF